MGKTKAKPKVRVLEYLVGEYCPTCARPRGKGLVKRVYPHQPLMRIEGYPKNTADCERCKSHFTKAA